jgi:hypothetical protein
MTGDRKSNEMSPKEAAHIALQLKNLVNKFMISQVWGKGRLISPLHL